MFHMNGNLVSNLICNLNLLTITKYDSLVVRRGKKLALIRRTQYFNYCVLFFKRKNTKKKDMGDEF
jgi:hypothetical protein